MHTLFAVIGVVILLQVATGITFGGGEDDIGLRRSEQPKAFWGRVLAQVVVLGIAIVLLDRSLANKLSAGVVSVVDQAAQEVTAVTTQAPQADSAIETASAPKFRSRHQELVAIAFERAKQGENGPASHIYGQLIAEADTSAWVRYARAMTYWKMNKMDSALTDFWRVAQMQPDHYDARVGIDRVLEQRGRWDEILTSWNEYLKLKPEDARAYYERGGTNYRKGDRAAALRDATKACELGLKEACNRAASLR